MNDGRMNLVLTMCACFCAIQAGSLVICVGITLLYEGLGMVLAGIGFWATGQVVIIPAALLLMGPGALLRWIVSLLAKNPFKAALGTGLIVGTIGAILFSAGFGQPFFPEFIPVVLLGAIDIKISKIVHIAQVDLVAIRIEIADHVAPAAPITSSRRSRAVRSGRKVFKGSAIEAAMV